MSLLSIEFFVLAGLAVVLLNALRGWPRMLAFLALSGWFAQSYLTVDGIVSTLLFVGAGFVAARLAERRPATRLWSVSLLTAAFVYLRGYDFLAWLLPESFLTQLLATAGLSFLFFKVVHVVVEAGSRTLGPLTFPEYLAYCLNFTTFLLGPIQRFQSFRADWRGETEVLEPRLEAWLDALNRVLRGLVKKFVLAAFVAPYALAPEVDVATMSWLELTLAAYVFYLFLYLDFSGYCDVVIGIGSLMGVRPPENFDLPFLSPNVSQYWLRVHRSLTTWLTDFVFNPLYLRGLRRTRGRVPVLVVTFGCLFVTMLVAGVWHGTTSSFIVFGLVHAVYLIGFRGYEALLKAQLGAKRLRRWRATATSRVLGVVFTFHLTSLAYVPFVLKDDQLVALGERVFG